jgi:hypothetical protein
VTRVATSNTARMSYPFNRLYATNWGEWARSRSRMSVGALTVQAVLVSGRIVCLHPPPFLDKGVRSRDGMEENASAGSPLAEDRG